MSEWNELFRNKVIPIFQEIKDEYEKKECKVKIVWNEADINKNPAATIKIMHKQGDFEYAVLSTLTSTGGRLAFEVRDNDKKLTGDIFPGSIDGISKKEIRQNFEIGFRKWQMQKWPERKI